MTDTSFPTCFQHTVICISDLFISIPASVIKTSNLTRGYDHPTVQSSNFNL
jgi:hypothetical protein